MRLVVHNWSEQECWFDMFQDMLFGVISCGSSGQLLPIHTHMSSSRQTPAVHHITVQAVHTCLPVRDPHPDTLLHHPPATTAP
jgi:hypothetical protein